MDEIFKIYKIVIGGASKPMTGYVFSLKANKHLAYSLAFCCIYFCTVIMQ